MQFLIKVDVIYIENDEDDKRCKYSLRNDVLQ